MSAGAALALSGVSGCGRRSSGKLRLTYNTHWTDLDAHAPVTTWLCSQFRLKYPQVDFQATEVAGGAQDNGRKLMAELAAGAGPDILHDTTYDHVRAAYCLDLTDFVNERRDRFYPAALAACTYDGRTYQLPTEYSYVPCIWNTRVLEKVGKGIPKTFEEYLELGEAFKRKGISLTSLSIAGHAVFFSILFGHPDAVEAIAREEWESEPFRRAVSAVKQIVDGGFVPDNDIELQFGGAASLFQRDQLGHYANGAWTLINEITAPAVDPRLRNHVEFTPFPAYGGVRPIRAWVATKTALNSSLKDDKEKLKYALKFLELMVSDEAARRFVSDAHSPEGIKVDVTEQMAGPLLYKFIKSRDLATSVFTLPNKPGFFNEQVSVRALPDMFASLNEGASADRALKFFAEVLRS
ncbi:MAG: ABC transporter substrate-binding protein [Armatimonadota bacterium]|nr:ABC transporter substrate-binding protein [Armatimonadota bacterium]